MDYLKKSVKTGKALYTAVDGAIRNPDQFLAQGQQQQQNSQQQYYQQQQIPQGQVQGQPQYNLQQPPPFPPRPVAQPHNNGPNHSVSYQQQTTGYTQSPQLPPRPQTVGPYSQQQVFEENQQYQTVNQQFTGHTPTNAPYTQTPHPTNSQPAWQPPQQVFCPVQQPSQPAFSPMQPPPQSTFSPQPVFTPLQSSQPYSPPPIGAFSPLASTQPYSQMSPVQPVSPITSYVTPVSQPFSPPLPSSTPGIESHQLSTYTYSFPPYHDQYQGDSTPPPPTQNPIFGSHAGLALNPYHAPSAIPSSGPIVPQPSHSPQLLNTYSQSGGPMSPPPSQSPQFPKLYNQPSSECQQAAFIAELPEDNFASQAVELPAELPADLLPSNPAEHNRTGDDLAHTRAISEQNTGIHIGTSGIPTDTARGQPEGSPSQSLSMGGETPIIPTSTVTPNEQIQQPAPLHPQPSVVPAAHTTPPPAQWQPPASFPSAVYSPSVFPPMPGSPQSQSSPFQQAQSAANTSGYIAYSQSQQPAPYQQPHTENQGYVAYGQQQQPVPQPAYSNPVPLGRMGSLAQRAQQLSLSNVETNGPSAQFPYRAAGNDDYKGSVQQQSFGYAQQNHTQRQVGESTVNVNAPGYHPHGLPPPYIQ